MLSSLLPELKCLLLSYLNRSDMGLLAQVSQEFHRLVAQPWYWKARINREFPTMLRWFPHEDTASGRESLRAYYYFLVDTEYLREAGRKEAEAVKAKIMQSPSEIVELELYQSKVPLRIDSDGNNIITEYTIEVNFLSHTIEIVFLDQEKKTPTSCCDQGKLLRAIPRVGPVVVQDATPAEAFESLPRESDGSIHYYTITYDEFLPWFEIKIAKGYLCMDNIVNSSLPAELIQRHYNWFLDYTM